MLPHTLSWKWILLFWTQGAELLEIHLVQVEFNKIISLDFILLCANWQSNWVFTSHLAVWLQIQTAASPSWGCEGSHRITFPLCWLTTAWKWEKFAKYRWIIQLTFSFCYSPVPAFPEFIVQFQIKTWGKEKENTTTNCFFTCDKREYYEANLWCCAVVSDTLLHRFKRVVRNDQLWLLVSVQKFSNKTIISNNLFS